MSQTKAQLESKRMWVESIQKDMTEVCFNQCFDTHDLDIDGNCLKTCYNKYKEVLNLTNNKLKELGYTYESQIAYKIWKKNHPMNFMYYQGPLSPYQRRTKFV